MAAPPPRRIRLSFLTGSTNQNNTMLACLLRTGTTAQRQYAGRNSCENDVSV